MENNPRILTTTSTSTSTPTTTVTSSTSTSTTSTSNTENPANNTSGVQEELPPVYARLYDPKSYTGIYRKRFEKEVYDASETIVHDLSIQTRPNLNKDIGVKRSSKIRSISFIGANAENDISPNSSPEEKTGVFTSNTPSKDATAAASTDKTTTPEKPPITTSESSPKLKGDPNDPHTLLRAVFKYYCRFGRTGPKGVGEKTLDNANFVKFCRDCPQLIDSRFSKIDVDLIFIKSKKKGERRINYTRFLDALGMIALQKYPEIGLEISVPKLLEMHIAKLPCVVEFTHGKSVQAIWLKRAEKEEQEETLTTSCTGTGTLPPPAPFTAASAAATNAAII